MGNSAVSPAQLRVCASLGFQPVRHFVHTFELVRAGLFAGDVLAIGVSVVRPFIDLEAQQLRIRPELDAALARVLNHGKYIMGPEIEELEELLAAYVGTKHCVACGSGTDALLLGLMALEVGPGDAVFTTPFTFIATAETIALAGGTPVFVDIDGDTYNMDPQLLDEAIKRTKDEGKLAPKAIMPVDLFGLPAAYAEILAVADAHGVPVLEDAAQAFGAEYNGRRCPAFGRIGATSFFPAKPLGCYGDGGAVFTDDSGLNDAVRSLRIHGKGTDKYSNVRVGLNARMDTIQAAVLLEKLRIYDDEMVARQHVAEQYRAELHAHCRDAISDGHLTLPVMPAEGRCVWAQFSVESDLRDDARAALKDVGVPTAVYYPTPLHLLPPFSGLGYSTGAFPVSEHASERIFSLPMHPYLDDETIRLVASTLARVV